MKSKPIVLICVLFGLCVCALADSIEDAAAAVHRVRRGHGGGGGGGGHGHSPGKGGGASGPVYFCGYIGGKEGYGGGYGRLMSEDEFKHHQPPGHLHVYDGEYGPIMHSAPVEVAHGLGPLGPTLPKEVYPGPHPHPHVPFALQLPSPQVHHTNTYLVIQVEDKKSLIGKIVSKLKHALFDKKH